MFVVSMKATRRGLRWLAMAAGIVLLLVLFLAGRQDVQRTNGLATGADDARRVAYLQELGYSVSSQPVAVQEVVIPAAVNEKLLAYNALQKAAGQDLTPYIGRRVKCWTYAVTNYPGSTGAQAHLFVFDEQIIGGDISAAGENGFCHGLIPLGKAATGEENGKTG